MEKTKDKDLGGSKRAHKDKGGVHKDRARKNGASAAFRT
jgi:hypothetical protein